MGGGGGGGRRGGVMGRIETAAEVQVEIAAVEVEELVEGLDTAAQVLKSLLQDLVCHFEHITSLLYLPVCVSTVTTVLVLVTSLATVTGAAMGRNYVLWHIYNLNLRT